VKKTETNLANVKRQMTLEELKLELAQRAKKSGANLTIHTASIDIERRSRSDRGH
jgi:hypothetical protein